MATDLPDAPYKPDLAPGRLETEVVRMPFTPFHFGLGIAAKAALSLTFSLALFIALQVVIDLESLYNLAYGRFPVHRLLHTFLGATLLAILASVLILGI